MKRDHLLLIGFVSLLAVSGIAYYSMNKKKKDTSSNKPDSKADAIAIIVGAQKSTNVNNGLNSFEEEFLKNWATAINNKKTVFDFKNKTYNTLGGRAL